MERHRSIVELVQGSSSPEIASASLIVHDELMFAAGNLSQQAIDNFIALHTYGFFCKCLDLEPLRD